MTTLTHWVSDQLQNILGYSESNIESFIISLAKDHVETNKTSEEFIQKLKQADFPENETTRQFATELMNKIPRSNKQPVMSEYKKQHDRALDMLRKNAKYDLVSMSDDDIEEIKEVKVKKKKTKRKLRQKSDKSVLDDTEPIEPVIKKQKVEKTEEELKEEARLQDMKERDEFHLRMIEKSKKEQKNIVENKGSRKSRKEA